MGKLILFPHYLSMSSPHILVVCTANICRSPVAEALLRVGLRERGLGDWIVDSAGTWAIQGQHAAPFSVELMLERGIDIKNHRSQPVGEDLMQQADLVLCLETGHVKTLNDRYPHCRFKNYTLRQMAGKRGSVRDPYGGPRRFYEKMVAEVAELVESGIVQIQTVTRQNQQKRGAHGSG